MPPRRWLWWVIGGGLIVRLLLAPISAQADLETYAESSATIAYGGSIYTYLIVYPPGWVLILADLGRLVASFVPAYALIQANPTMDLVYLQIGAIEPTALPNPIYSLAEKSLLFVFDLLISILLYRIVIERTGNVGQARIAFVLWFLNPFVIWVSAVHGAYDVLPAFFAVVAAYLLFHHRTLSAGAALGIGTVLKLFPIFLLPLFALVLVQRIRDERRVGMREALGFSAGLGAILADVFWPPGLLSTYLVIVTTGPTVGIPFGGIGVWSFTSLPLLSGPRNYLYLHSADVLVAALIGALLLIVAFAVRHATGRPSTNFDAPFTQAALGTTVASLVLFSTAQVQYILWLLPWLVLVVVLERRLRGSLLIVLGFGLLGYLFALAGPVYFFQPLSVYGHFFPMTVVENDVGFWAAQFEFTRPAFGIPVSAALAYVGVRSFRLSRRRQTEGE